MGPEWNNFSMVPICIGVWCVESGREYYPSMFTASPILFFSWHPTACFFPQIFIPKKRASKNLYCWNNGKNRVKADQNVSLNRFLFLVTIYLWGSQALQNGCKWFGGNVPVFTWCLHPDKRPILRCSRAVTANL